MCQEEHEAGSLQALQLVGDAGLVEAMVVTFPIRLKNYYAKKNAIKKIAIFHSVKKIIPMRKYD